MGEPTQVEHNKTTSVGRAITTPTDGDARSGLRNELRGKSFTIGVVKAGKDMLGKDPSATLAAMSQLNSKTDRVYAALQKSQGLAIEGFVRTLADATSTATSNTNSILYQAKLVMELAPNSPELKAADDALGALESALTDADAGRKMVESVQVAASRSTNETMAQGTKARTLHDQLHSDPQFAKEVVLVERIQTSVQVTRSNYRFGRESLARECDIEGTTAESRGWIRDNGVGLLTEYDVAAIRPMVANVRRENHSVWLSCDFFPTSRMLSRAEFDADPEGVTSALREEGTREERRVDGHHR